MGTVAERRALHAAFNCEQLPTNFFYEVVTPEQLEAERLQHVEGTDEDPQPNPD